MSHYWHLACLDCDDHRGGFGNDQSQWDVEMHLLAQSAEALATVATILQSINQRGRNLELKVSQWDNTLLLEWVSPAPRTPHRRRGRVRHRLRRVRQKPAMRVLRALVFLQAADRAQRRVFPKKKRRRMSNGGEALRDRDVERFKRLESVRERLAIAREVGDDRAAPLRDAVSVLAGLVEDIVRELASGAPR